MAQTGGGFAESSTRLLARARAGDREAVDALFARYLPRLRRWARGRLPAWARDLLDTDDLVQKTVLNALGGLDGFEIRREGAFQAYLRQVLLNQIRDELRRVRRRGAAPLVLDGEEIDPGPSPLEQTAGRETLARYEAALARLKPEEREAIIARVEMGGS